MKFTEEKFQAWEKTRQKGIAKYIAVNGGLFFGLPMGIGFLLFDHFVRDASAAWFPQLLVYIIIGAFVSWPGWILNEESRKAYLADLDDQ